MTTSNDREPLLPHDGAGFDPPEPHDDAPIEPFDPRNEHHELTFCQEIADAHSA
jgi:hypothetical protein